MDYELILHLQPGIFKDSFEARNEIDFTFLFFCSLIYSLEWTVNLKSFRTLDNWLWVLEQKITFTFKANKLQSNDKVFPVPVYELI